MRNLFSTSTLRQFLVLNCKVFSKMDFLEYTDVIAEVKGAMTPGRLKLTDQHLIFKNQKTGKVEQISASDMEMVNYQKFIGTWGLRIFLKNGTLHRFRGFKEGDQEKIAKFFLQNYKKDMLEKELSLKGWNWGTARFNGSVLSFDVGHHTAFEIPLYDVSQCNTGKNEVTLEFHQNDDAPVSLMEMRFHIPISDSADQDPVEAFHQQVMEKASVISVSGDAIAIFREIQCLTPRGRYDIKIFQSFFQLHGKTFDYKIPMSTVLRLFLLPHKDNRQMYFVVSLDPPIKQGQTRYHYLVLLFNQEEETSIELPFSEKELKEKYEDKLPKELSGPTYEVLGKVMKVIINRKLTGPGNFISHSGTLAISCSFKAAAGYLYPLERGFIYVHKPPIHIRFEEIASVNFARGGGSTRSFDFEIELTSGVVHTFSSIEKEEYGKLFDFITSKKLRVKNRGKSDKLNYDNDFGDSDQEDEPDAYLARVKAEAQERDAEENQDSEEESTDEDFNPNQDESDVAEEYDSNPNSSESENESDASGKSQKKEKKEKREKKPKSAKTVSEKPRKPRKQKKEKDANKPKRPPTAFMIWLNSARERIKAENPGIAVTEIAKKGGEMWRELKDKSEWEQKAAKAKKEYTASMKEYEASGGGGGDKEKISEKKEKGEKKRKESKKESPSKLMTGTSFKSKEYISDDESSSDEDNKKSEKKASDEDSDRGKEKKSGDKRSAEDDDKKLKKKRKEESEGSDEEPIESTPPSSEAESKDSD
ncbi:structure specific recognition protein isoform X1 [Bombus vancouverensis nearcticus]|uniref:FACT complex subunit SSRP1 n=2 Tax=Bombus bifarius TaxID=103933 RepID=A0A6P8M2U7_9HYME|nr:FACT complex subunit Ssrp1 isoform X1 [Bombus vancouverensis nearcticus]XP_033297070.1 FACT complex subunit Ssrp1 isoform X1 [Bombus bifarius]